MAFPTIPTTLIIIVIFLALYLIQRPKHKYPPGPRPWPIVGNIYNLKPVMFRCFHEWAQIYGPIISVWFGPNLNVVVSSSKLAKEVLKDHDLELADRQRTRSQANFTKNGVDLTWADYGPHYVNLRKLCTLELFTNKRMEAFRPIREDEVNAMIESIYKDITNFSGDKLGMKSTIEIRKYLGQVVVNHITRITMGKRFINNNNKSQCDDNDDDDDDRQLGKELMSILHGIRNIKKPSMVIEHIPCFHYWLSCFYDPILDNHRDRLDRFAKRIMHEAEAVAVAVAEVEDSEHRHHGHRHLVEALVSPSFKDEYCLSEDINIMLIWDMIIAGMDTIAITVEWAMTELIKHPRVMQKAQYELDRVIGSERVMTEQDLENLPYLQAIVKESLRLHPPTPLMLPHQANASVKIGGYDIPKGTTIRVNVWAISRDPNVWPNPNEFRPERFLEEDVDMMGHDFRLLPFGSGRRVCLGATTATKLVASMLGHLLHHFNWSPTNGVKAHEISMAEIPGLVSYMAIPLQIVPLPRLSQHLYKRVAVDI